MSAALRKRSFLARRRWSRGQARLYPSDSRLRRSKADHFWGTARQEYTHEQLDDKRPIDNFLEALAPASPDIARITRVVLIAVDLPYTGPGVQTVDIAGQILDWLKSEEATRWTVGEHRHYKEPFLSLP